MGGGGSCWRLKWPVQGAFATQGHDSMTHKVALLETSCYTPQKVVGYTITLARRQIIMGID